MKDTTVGRTGKSEETYISIAILQKPQKLNGILYKGALIVNKCDFLCTLIPNLKTYFYLIERNGWTTANNEKTADIKLVENPNTVIETKEKFPQAIVLEYANADFVDTDIFKPLPVEKKYTGIQIATWKKYKRHELFVWGVALLPHKKFIKFGHFWSSHRKLFDLIEELFLRYKIVLLSKYSGANIYYPFNWFSRGNAHLPKDPITVNTIINSAKMGILTTSQEGVNRFKMECLSANIPFLMPNDVGEQTKKHIVRETGVFFEPTPKGLADAIEYVESHYQQFSPRAYILKNTGIHIALPKLKESLRMLAQKDGSSATFENIYWDGRNQSMMWGATAIEAVRRIITDLQ